MAARICPHCMKPIPARFAVAFSDGLDCPHCETRLEVTSASRMPASFAGLLAGWLAWRLTSNSGDLLGSLLPELYAFLVFGIVSALVLLFTADLQMAPVVPVSQAPAVAHSHAPSHH